MTTPTSTDPVRHAFTLEFGGDRNLVLRNALGLIEGEIGMINNGDVLQVVVGSHARAMNLLARIQSAVGFHGYAAAQVRQDGAWLITAYLPEE